MHDLVVRVGELLEQQAGHLRARRAWEHTTPQLLAAARGAAGLRDLWVRLTAGARAAIDDADLNGDGVVNYAEFRHALSSARRKSGDRLAPLVS